MLSSRQPATPLGDVQGSTSGRTVQDTFRIFVGHCGDGPEALLLVADANGLFGLALDTVRLMQLPAMVVLGIGYPTSRTIADTIAIRQRDLTPTPSASFPGSGGGVPVGTPWARSPDDGWMSMG